MSDDDILREFGFDPDERLNRGGRGKVIDMTGRIVGSFKGIRRADNYERDNGNSEAAWVVECVKCKTQRVARGSLFGRSEIRCHNCHKTTRVKDWDNRFSELFSAMVCAIKSRDFSAMKQLGPRLTYAATKLLEREKE